MKTKQILMLIALFSSCSMVVAQTDDNEPEVEEQTNEVYEWYQTQEVAAFPGGPEAMDSFINANLELSDSAYEHASSGTVIVRCVVEPDGALTQITLVGPNMIGYGVEEAVIEVFKKMPKWEPAMVQDKPCRMRNQTPIKLRLN